MSKKVVIAVYRDGKKIGYGNSEGSIENMPKKYNESAVEKLHNDIRTIHYMNSNVDAHIEWCE